MITYSENWTNQRCDTGYKYKSDIYSTENYPKTKSIEPVEKNTEKEE